MAADQPQCVIKLPMHRGTPATWVDANSGIYVCDRHRSQFEERADEFGPFCWVRAQILGSADG